MSEESHKQTPEKTSKPDTCQIIINHMQSKLIIEQEEGNLLDANKYLAMLVMKRKNNREGLDSPAVPMQVRNSGIMPSRI